MGVQELKEMLQRHGIQASSPRLAIADFVLSTHNHPTAEEVKEEVEKRTPSVSLATIYNTLNLFVEKGLLTAVKDPASDKLRYDCNTRPHFHFYDEKTGKLVDLDPSVLRISPDFSKLNAEFEVTGIEVTVKGRRRIKPLQKNNPDQRKGVNDGNQ